MAKSRTQHTVASLYAHCDEEGECLLWRGYLRNKTPQVYYRGRMWPTRRVILDLLGQNPTGGYVFPRCTDQRCIRREHYRIETDLQHQLRMAKAANVPSLHHLRTAKAVQTRLERGTNKLTPEQASEIRTSQESERTLASRYQVNRTLIGRIRRGRSWRLNDNPFAGLMGGAA